MVITSPIASSVTFPSSYSPKHGGHGASIFHLVFINIFISDFIDEISSLYDTLSLVELR